MTHLLCDSYKGAAQLQLNRQYGWQNGFNQPGYASQSGDTAQFDLVHRVVHVRLFGTLLAFRSRMKSVGTSKS
jgi:hypothetical protein